MSAAAWSVARRQHWVVARAQLLALGFHPKAIEHRVEAGRLFPVHAGVYAVGRRALSREGQWFAAVLACGPEAFLSHRSAAHLWGLLSHESRPIDVSIRVRSGRRRPGIKIHCRPSIPEADISHHQCIPLTSRIRTLLDLATILSKSRLERVVNEADRLDLIDPESLRAALTERSGQPGVRPLRALLDRHTFRMTESELERHFLGIARAAGLPAPQTQATVNGFRVDFYWPDLRLIVETDGLRYHRTPATQSRDARRDQAHTAAGLTVLRFSHAQAATNEWAYGGLLPPWPSASLSPGWRGARPSSAASRGRSRSSRRCGSPPCGGRSAARRSTAPP